MRDIALLLAFLWALGYAFKHTWAGVLLWTWFSIMNPHRLTYGFANGLPFAAVAAAVTLLSILWNRKNLKVPNDSTVITLIVFVIWMCITTAAAFHLQRAIGRLETVLKIQLMTLVAIAAIRERKHIELFIWVNVLSLAFYGTKGGIFTIVSGGSARVWGPGGSLIEGNNELGLALIMMIPLANYLRVTSPRPWVRRGLAAAMVLSAAAALGTQSRGAFLAFIAMGFVLWVRSSKKLVSAIAIIGLGAALVSFMPSSWEQRMSTIKTYEQDQSAMGRINAWTAAFNIANDRITGGGFEVEGRDVFDRYAPEGSQVLTAHSIYFQALGEQGWIGLALFLSLGALTFWNAGQIRRKALNQEASRWLYDLSGMVQVSMVGYGVGGAFLSLAYFDLPYNVMVIMIACKCWLQEERWRTETHGAFGSSVPIAALSKVPQGAVRSS